MKMTNVTSPDGGRPYPRGAGHVPWVTAGRACTVPVTGRSPADAACASAARVAEPAVRIPARRPVPHLAHTSCVRLSYVRPGDLSGGRPAVVRTVRRSASRDRPTPPRRTGTVRRPGFRLPGGAARLACPAPACSTGPARPAVTPPAGRPACPAGRPRASGGHTSDRTTRLPHPVLPRPAPAEVPQLSGSRRGAAPAVRLSPASGSRRGVPTPPTTAAGPSHVRPSPCGSRVRFPPRGSHASGPRRGAFPRPAPAKGRAPAEGRPPPRGGSRRSPYASGRTTPSIGIDPAPAMVTVRPGRGACTIAPSPMYIATWLASSK